MRSRAHDYDLNGGMTVRGKGLSSQQTLRWDSHARLAQVTGAGVSESYLYDVGGQRIRKTVGIVDIFYPFADYEQTSGGVVTKHYSFGGAAVAVRRGSGIFSYLYQDGVNSTVYTTDGGGYITSILEYYAFGGTRSSAGTVPTDRHFTGQREDATGLYYFNSRYYDPQLGQFLSPDTVVPDPAQLIDYNRYLYARGNPLKYNDPSGHYSIDELKQHFGVSSFDELMALFEKGGAYAGLEGWYDVLRFAQDGDTINATNEVAGFSLTGTFIRSAQGKIQIDRGEWGIVPESVFAQFGGIITQGEVGKEYIIGIGTYELRGQEYAWRRAIVGGRRHGDMQSCNNVDCIAATFDGIGIVGAGLQKGSAVCGPYAGGCVLGGRVLSTVGTVGGVARTAWIAWEGGASAADIAATVVTTVVGSVSKDPVVELGAGVAQFLWDVEISPYQR